MKRKYFWWFLALLIIFSSCAAASGVGVDPVLKEADGGQFVFVPAATKDPAPLVVVLHGYDGDARSMARLWNLQKGFGGANILAPQAPTKSRGGKSVSTWTAGADDDFVIALMDRVMNERAVDRSRVAMVGYSAGASMAIHLAMTHADRFRACVAVGGGASQSKSISPGRVKYFFLAGQYDGGFKPSKAEIVADRIRNAGGSAESAVVPSVDHAGLYSHVDKASAWLGLELGLIKP